MKSNQLRPYQSYHVFKDAALSKPQWKKPLKQLLEEIFELTQNSQDETSTIVHKGQFSDEPNGLHIGWLTYTKELPVAWAEINARVFDRENHVLLVAAMSDHVAISTSDKSLAGRLDRLAPSSTQPALTKLSRVAPEVLEAALIAGNAHILWMSAIHRDQAIRPNAKVLIGTNLEASLDPLSDQTFHYTSVRSDGPRVGAGGAFGKAVPGVSPRKGRVWLRPSKDYDDFITNSATVLEFLEKAKPNKVAIFPILAHAMPGLTGVKNAFDYMVLPPESEISGETTLASEFELASELKWVVRGKKTSSNVNLTTTVAGTKYEVEIRLLATSAETTASAKLVAPVLAPATATTPAPPLPEEIACSLKLFESDAMKIYYDSGHTYSSRAIYEVLTRPIPFSGFTTSPFTNADIELEKPTKPHPSKPKIKVAELIRIGTSGEESLFTWTFHQRKKNGWLWCDDGSGEIADFIHVGETDNTLTLIHIKAAHSKRAHRDVAVSAYEVVCSQALKNMRMLEGRDIAAALHQKIHSKKPYPRCWHNGAVIAPANEIRFAEKIAGIPLSKLRRRVVVVQPHIVLTDLPKTPAELAKVSPEVHRAKQLHTLLNGFAANFRNLDIEFEVIVSA